MAGISMSQSMNDHQAFDSDMLDYPSYFTSMVLAVYDNILGPTVLKVWVGKQDSRASVSPPPSEHLLMISSFSVKDEVGRESVIDGIETKFYCLERMNLIACSYIFKAPLRGGKLSIFAFFVTLPYEELSNFMALYSLCESNVSYLLTKYFIAKLEACKMEPPSRVPVKDQVSEHLVEFKSKLLGLCQLMTSVSQDCLKQVIGIENTYLGRDLMDKTFPQDFLLNAITCHLQLGGYTVVFGDSKHTVNKMINTLALFLSPNERKLSRYVNTGKRYIADLYLQGYIKKSDGMPPFSLECLWRNRFPSTVIDVDRSKVYFNESTVSAFLRRKYDDSCEKSPRMLEELQVFDKGKDGKIIKEYIRQIQMLPDTDGVREAYTQHFVHTLRLKAVSICKYLESESNHTLESDLELSTNDSVAPRVSKDLMMTELGFGDSHIDHLILLCFVEKLRPGSYLEVIGDPQKDIEKILSDLEFV